MDKSARDEAAYEVFKIMPRMWVSPTGSRIEADAEDRLEWSRRAVDTLLKRWPDALKKWEHIGCWQPPVDDANYGSSGMFARGWTVADYKREVHDNGKPMVDLYGVRDE